MSRKITKINSLPDLWLEARFDSGETVRYDVKPLVKRWPVFQSLVDIKGLFPLVRIEAAGYGVAWNDEIDLASEEIWENGITIESEQG
jgi:hypothetical protein